jgi:hypothetical protein
VFDLIDLHRKADAAHLAAIEEANRLERMRGVSWVDWGSITEKPCHDENDAFEVLVGAAATTLAWRSTEKRKSNVVELRLPFACSTISRSYASLARRPEKFA